MHGFILNAEVKQADNKSTLYYYGILENKKRFTVEISEAYYLAFCPAGAEPLPTGVNKRVSGKFRDFNLNPVDCLYFQDQSSLRQAFFDAAIELFESDVDPLYRYLSERKLGLSLEFLTEPTEQSESHFFYKNPELKSSPFLPRLKTLSFDIENGIEDQLLYSISLHAPDYGKVLMLADERKTEDFIEYYPKEEDLLHAFIEAVAEIDPDIFIGWNVVNYDFRFLIDKFAKYQVPFKVGQSRETVTYQPIKNKKDIQLFIPGRVTLDGIPVLRALGLSFENYSLEAVGGEIIGEGKLIASDENKVSQIDYQFKHEKRKLAEYNLQDSELVTKIFDKLKVIPIFSNRSRMTGVFLDKHLFASDALDNVYLPLLHRHGFCAPATTKNKAPQSDEGSLHFFREGLFENISVIHCENLFAQLMGQYGFEPLSRFLGENLQDEKQITHLPGTELPVAKMPPLLNRKIQKFLTVYQKENTRPEIKQAIAQVLNQFIRAFSMTQSRFYSPAMHSALKQIVLSFLDVLREKLLEEGANLVLVDREKFFIAIEEGSALNDEQHLSELFQSTWLEFHKSGSALSVSKNISRLEAVFTHQSGKIKTVAEYSRASGFQFIESLNSGDFCPFSQNFRENLLLSLIHKGNPRETIEESFNELESMDIEPFLFKKKLRRTAEQYEGQMPDHVQAAQKAELRRGATVKYFYDKEGPCPLQLAEGKSIDKDYYILEVLKPWAEIILQNSAYNELIELFQESESQLSFFG